MGSMGSSAFIYRAESIGAEKAANGVWNASGGGSGFSRI